MSTYACDKCSMSFEKEWLLKRHSKTQFSCELKCSRCFLVSPSRTSFYRHRQTCDKTRPKRLKANIDIYECDLTETVLCTTCQKKFKDQHNLDQHLIETRCHLRCVICKDTICDDQLQLRQHMKLCNDPANKIIKKIKGLIEQSTICMK